MCRTTRKMPQRLSNIIYTHSEGETPSASPTTSFCQISKTRFICALRKEINMQINHKILLEALEANSCTVFFAFEACQLIKCLIYSGKRTR